MPPWLIWWFWQKTQRSLQLPKKIVPEPYTPLIGDFNGDGTDEIGYYRSAACAFCVDVDGDNYAQSRYLLQYLQEKGLLHAYYRAFHAARAEDPTGYETLKTILDIDDMDAFQSEWARWVMTLSLER